MRNKILFLSISFIFIIFSNISYAAVYCSPELQGYVDRLQQIPEGRALIQEIEKEGPVSVVIKNTQLSNTFGAYWDCVERTVCIAVRPNTTPASIFQSIIFELHNASVNKKFAYYNQLAAEGKITKDDYIRSMEYLEYLNSINGAKLSQKGIDMGLLPKEAHLFTYKNFDDHYAMQRKSGHSDCFARNYDDIVRYWQWRFNQG